MENMAVAEIGFTIGDQRYELTPPTARIAFRVSRLLGGLGPALTRLERGDLDAYAALLKTACPAAPREEKALEAFVFEHAARLALPLLQYVGALHNGGRLQRTPEEGATGEPEGNAQAAAAPATPPAA